MMGRWWKVAVCLLLITFQVARSEKKLEKNLEEKPEEKLEEKSESKSESMSEKKSEAAKFHGGINSFACSTSGPRMQCGGPGSNENQNECLRNPRCCWSPGPTKPNCYVNMGAGSFRAEMEHARNALGHPPSRQISSRPLQMAARNLNVSASERMQLDGRAGMYNMQSAASAVIFGFPTCPLNVPVCHRVRCQPYNSLSESNPNECYKDPRCCFDTELFVHKYILGSSFLGDAPVCFMGPTSNRFMEITRMIQPWSPFYMRPVMDIFERYLDLQLDFQQTRQCHSSNIFDVDMLRTPKCGWEGITKLECNLKGCCYNSNTGNCAYPQHLFQHNGRGIMSSDMQQFPELFQSQTTQCVKNGIVVDRFEVFKRLPCAQSSVSTGSTSSDLLNLFQTCPSTCCKNQMALFPGVNDLSKGGQPSRYALSNSPYATYLSNPLVSQAVVNLFCPYYYVHFPGLGDLSHAVRGCCKQTACYHKSLRSIMPLETASWGGWSAWSPCNAMCGQQGEKSRERRCLMHGTHTQQANSMCGGGLSYETHVCYGECGTSNYGWAMWGQWSVCQGPCGGQGTKRRYRNCPVGNTCPGSQVESSSCLVQACAPNQPWVSWGTWSQWTECMSGQQMRSRYRTCLYLGREMEPIGDSICEFVHKTAPTEEQPCHYNPHPHISPGSSSYSWTNWSSWSMCSQSCGAGQQSRTRYCVNNFTKQRTSSTSLCGPAYIATQSKDCYGSSPWCMSGLLN